VLAREDADYQEGVYKEEDRHSSPVHIPLVEQEPLLRLGQVNVNVLVDAAHDKYLVVIADGLRAEELLWLFQGTVHAFDFANLCVQREAVRDPAVVAAENEDLGVIQGEAAHSVASRPVVLAVYKDYGLPLLLFQVAVAVQPLNRVQRLFVLRVSASDDVEVAAVEHANGVVVTRGVELSDLHPLVLGDFIHLALLGRLVWVLRADGK